MTPGTEPTVPVGAHPDPVLVYTTATGSATVVETNDAWDRTLGAVSPETEVAAVLDRFAVVEPPALDGVGVAPAGEADAGTEALLATLLEPTAGTDRLYLRGWTGTDGTADAGPADDFLLRVLPEGDGGLLVVTPLEGVPELAAAADVERVAGAITHDLRNPLDVATAHLEAATTTGDGSHLDAIADAHDRMRTIIRDVLTLARGREAVDATEAVPVAEAVEAAWGSVETTRATLTLETPLPTTTADRDRLRRLFENLLRNAVEHGTTPGEDGAPEVAVSVGPLADDEGFYVADDGPGIGAERRAVVRRPGYSTTDSGAGLGLAIVDRIVAAHGWELTLTEGADGGTRAEVRVDAGGA